MSILKKDYPLLTLIVAVVALIASQLPPASEAFERPNISVKLSRNGVMNLNLDTVLLSFPVSMLNTGGKKGIVKNMDIFLSNKSNSFSAYMPQQQYVSDDIMATATTPVAATTFGYEVIEPTDSWKRTVQSGVLADTDTSNKLADLNEKVMAEIEPFTREPTEAEKGREDEIFQLSVPLQEAIAEHINLRFTSLTPDTYYLFIRLFDEEDNPIVDSLHTFELNKVSINTLTSVFQQYIQGAGFTTIFPLSLEKNHSVRIDFSEINDKDIVNENLERYRKSI